MLDDRATKQIFINRMIQLHSLNFGSLLVSLWDMPFIFASVAWDQIPLSGCYTFFFSCILSIGICLGWWLSNILQINSLLGTQVEWLYHILQAFNTGDLVRFQELCRVYNASLRAQPALVENEQKLLEKINILCLMEIIFRYPFTSNWWYLFL